MKQVRRCEVLSMVATIVAGVLANPVAGGMVTDQYARQQLMQQILWDVQNMFAAYGVEIID